jgi:hypothetical protein
MERRAARGHGYSGIAYTHVERLREAAASRQRIGELPQVLAKHGLSLAAAVPNVMMARLTAIPMLTPRG